MSFLHALVVALFTLLASWADQPAPVQTVPAPAVVAPAAPGAHTGTVAPPAAPTVAAPPITADSPVCGEEGAVPGACVQPQLPEETLGRAYG